MLDKKDLEQIKAQGLTREAILEQINIFQKGAVYSSLVRSCSRGDGILTLDDEAMEIYNSRFQDAMESGRVIKFIPASGAATRMFQSLLSLNNAYDQIDKRMLNPEDPQMEKNLMWFWNFIREIRNFPFYRTLKTVMERKGLDIEALLSKGEYKEILRTILDPDGLDYSNLPKALVIFHSYRDSDRTALEEHMVEGLAYTLDRAKVCRIHFTVLPEHKNKMDKFIKKARKKYERGGITYQIELSEQKPSTDTIALELDYQPFRDEEGKLFFRPGGHGALLENLMELDGEIVFIKNIDNVFYERKKHVSTEYKKALGGMLLGLQEKVFKYLTQLERCFTNGDIQDNMDDNLLYEMEKFCRDRINIEVPVISNKTRRIKFLWEKMNRPIRICGMIKNRGDQGGGPFWVKPKDGSESIQIVEMAQVDREDERQGKIWQSATHFNPVDMVCGLRNFRGEKFDLFNFRDETTSSISVKSSFGRPSLALEHPGLWNGSMAGWITVLVEVPQENFTPVKEITDLLNSEHQDFMHTSDNA
jgi:hypothetical protein